MIKLDIEIGDTILTGKFKNKKTTVKTIGKDEHGTPTVNGRSILKFRVPKWKQNIFNENKTMNKKQLIEKYTGNPGDKLTHKYSPEIEIELISPTNRGWKVYQTTNGKKKKIAFFDKQDITGDNSLFENIFDENKTMNKKQLVENYIRKIVKEEIKNLTEADGNPGKVKLNKSFAKKWATDVHETGYGDSWWNETEAKNWNVDQFKSWFDGNSIGGNKISDEQSKLLGIPKGTNYLDYFANGSTANGNKIFQKAFDRWGESGTNGSTALADIWVDIKKVI